MEGELPNVDAGALGRVLAEQVADQLSNIVLQADVDVAPVHTSFVFCILTRKLQRLHAHLRNPSDIRLEDVCDAWNSLLKEDPVAWQVPVADDYWVTFELHAEKISSLGAALQAAGRHGLLVYLNNGAPGFGTLSQEHGPQTVIESFDYTWQYVRHAWSIDVRLTQRSSASIHLRDGYDVPVRKIGDGESETVC
eukprot:5096593-Amphidinium_carterae.1